MTMRRSKFFFFALVALAALVGPAAAPARADEPHTAAVEKAEKGGQPEIFTPVRIDLGIWTLVVFLLLFFILARYAWGPMLEGLKRREETIRGALDDAQRTRDEAQRIRTELEQQLARANDQVRAILDEGRRAAERTTQEMTSKARAEIQAERERLHREIELARDQALQQIWGQTAHLATLAASKAIRRQLTLNPEDQRRLVDEALAELNDGNTNRGQHLPSAVQP
jgi:F-type H+-transporting ATPase subunit b